MSKIDDDQNGECISAFIPKALFERVEVICKSKGLNPKEFIFDAISEKLANMHKEKRKKPRL